MKLDELIAEFDDLDAEEKLELLIELADELPAVSASRGTAPFPETCLVRECQTPVYLWVDVEGERARLEADVPRNSPTVRGLVSLLVTGLDGEAVSQVLCMSDDLLSRLGLLETLGMTRQQGVRGVISRIKREIRAALARSDARSE